MAQKESKTFSVGFGIEAGVPVGQLSDEYSLAAGLDLRFAYHVGPGFVTLTVGAIGYDPKSVEGEPKHVGLEIPVRAGYKLIFVRHFFVMGEVGYSDFKTYYGDNGDLVSTTTGSFTVAPSVGVQFGVFEIGVRYTDILKANSGGVFGARLGFNF